jgi:hypothetical protein
MRSVMSNAIPIAGAQPRRRWSVAALFLSIVASGCGDSPASPSRTATVTFGVAGETFRARLVGDKQIEAARAAQGGGPARIPNGRVVVGAEVNVGWSWHLEDVEFVEVAIELCDGRPSDVERQGTGFGGGRFCPWNARVVALATSE